MVNFIVTILGSWARNHLLPLLWEAKARAHPRHRPPQDSMNIHPPLPRHTLMTLLPLLHRHTLHPPWVQQQQFDPLAGLFIMTAQAKLLSTHCKKSQVRLHSTARHTCLSFGCAPHCFCFRGGPAITRFTR